MELRHLRYFQAVATAHGFGRAAISLRVAQPALSRQIRALETELGTEVFIRSRKGVELTLAGRVLLPEAEAILGQVAHTINRARLAGRGLSGRCRIGVGKPVLWSGLIPRGIVLLSDSHKDIEIEIVETEAPEQWRLLLAGQLDMGLGLAPPGSETGLVAEPILDSQIDSALIAEDHLLAGKSSLTPEDLASLPLLSFQPSNAPELYGVVDQVLDRAGVTSARRFTYSTMQSVWTMVAAGRGWGLTSSRWSGRGPEGTVTIPLPRINIPFHLSLITRKGEDRSHVVSVMEAFRTVRDGVGSVIPPVEAAPARRSRRHSEEAALRGVELRHLHYFASLVDEGGFGRAAERLQITQPALSRQVRDLESAVGILLVKRIPRGVRVTAAGEALRAETDKLQLRMARLTARIKAADRGMRNQFVIGTITTSITARVISQALRLLHDGPGSLEPAVIDLATPNQPDALREGRIDIGICHSYPELAREPGLRHHQLLDDAIECALLSEHHPLARRESLEPEDLREIPFLFMPRSFHPSFYDHVLDELQRLGVPLRVDREYGGLQTVWSIAAQGEGWALGFRSHCDNPPEHLIAVPIEGLSMHWGLDLLWRKEDTNPHVATVIDALKQAGRNEKIRTRVEMKKSRTVG